MSTDPTEGRITVSLSTLRAELTSLELRLVDRLNGALQNKADRVLVDQLAQRVADYGSRITIIENQMLTKDGPVATKVDAIDEDVTSLKTVAGYKKWLWAQTLALVGIGVALVSIWAQQGISP